MRLLLYYMVHTFINAIKKLFKSWVAVVIAVSIAFGIFVGITAAVFGSFVDKVQNQTVVEEETQAELEDVTQDAMPQTPQEWDVVYQNITLVVLALTLLIFVMNIYPGQHSGEKLFTMADVNMLLTSPIRPQTILLYKTIQQMGLMLVSTIYVVFQLPNLVINLHIPVKCAVYLIGIWLLMAVFCKLASILVYTLTAGREWAKNIVRRGLIVAALLCGIFVFIAMQSQNLALLDAVRYVFLSKTVMYFPMIGYFVGLTYAALTGNFASSMIYVGLLIFGMIVMVYIIWHVKVDFYEDSITKASSYFEKMEAAKAGIQVNRKRKAKLKSGEIGKGWGASCFIVNQLYNRKRFAKLGIITNTGITYLSLAILVSLFTVKIAKVDQYVFVGITFLVLCYIRNYGNPIAKETSTSFLYLIPEKAFSKLGYSILGSSLIAAIDLLPAVVVSGIIVKSSIAECIFWLCIVVSFDFILSNTGLLVDLLLPTFVPDVVKTMFAMFFKMFGIVPMLVCLPLSFFFAPALLIGTFINILFGVCFLAVSSKLLVVGKN